MDVQDMTRGRLIEVVAQLRDAMRAGLEVIDGELRDGPTEVEDIGPRQALARVGGILTRALGRELATKPAAHNPEPDGGDETGGA